ncbi:MAG: hypothetical protein MUP81_01755 [Dehalococcoidia bacterium]|nr:hypothetical protein [Dehalococcoidia bacterium]
MKRRYIDKKFQKSSLALIEQANDIIEAYSADGYDLTLRQLYYQFVSRGVIANKQREYKRLGSVINDARLAGLIDWLAIVDRTRDFESLSHWDSPADILRSAASSYHIDLRSDQDEYIEVWVEKDALVGVIEKACKPLDVGYLSCRGYVSQSAMWSAAQRFIQAGEYHETTIIHLGDHDPSGIDMTRDIQDRLRMFGSDVTVRRIALTMEQIDELKPPPNPAKTTDSRYESYIAEYGEESWELDALDPRYIVDLITETIADCTNEDLFESQVAIQESQRKEIRKVADNWRE